MKGMLTPSEAVEAMGGALSIRSVRRRCVDGSLKAVRLGRLWLIPGWKIAELVERPPLDGPA
jgi:hypothetical protein